MDASTSVQLSLTKWIALQCDQRQQWKPSVYISWYRGKPSKATAPPTCVSVPLTLWMLRVSSNEQMSSEFPKQNKTSSLWNDNFDEMCIIYRVLLLRKKSISEEKDRTWENRMRIRTHPESLRGNVQPVHNKPCSAPLLHRPFKNGNIV